MDGWSFCPCRPKFTKRLSDSCFSLCTALSRSESSARSISTGYGFGFDRSKLRLPDIIFLHKDHFHARHNRVWDGADLVMEVVSEIHKTVREITRQSWPTTPRPK